MPSAANEVTIAAPPSDVFRFLAERENDLKWRQGIIELKHTSGSGVGARYTQILRGPRGRGIPADIEITELDPERTIAFRATAGPVRPRGRYLLTAAQGGTRVRFELDADLRGLKRLMAPMVQRTMDAEVSRLGALKQTIEAGL